MKKNIINFWMVSSLSSISLLSNGTIPVLAHADSEDKASDDETQSIANCVKSLNKADKTALMKTVAILDKADTYDNVFAQVKGSRIEFNVNGDTKEASCTGGCTAGGCDACVPAKTLDVDKTNIKQIEVGNGIDKNIFEPALKTAGYRGRVSWDNNTANLEDGGTLEMLQTAYPQVKDSGDLTIRRWTADTGLSDDAINTFRAATGDNVEDVLNDTLRRPLVRNALTS